MSEIDLLEIERGSITAPAGCGKTHLIATALKRHSSSKPVLVLTHTNAGVAALRNRLDKMQVPRSNYRISTLDGWAMRLVSTYPIRSEQNTDILALRNRNRDYPALRAGADNILRNHHVDDIIQATYSRVIVDEYQDCSLEQHFLIVYCSEILPTSVLGDTMQAIFNFKSNRLVDWSSDVEPIFPHAGTLTRPWRWENEGCSELGEWLLDARRALEAGQSLDISAVPAEVEWIETDGTEFDPPLLGAARSPSSQQGGSVLIVCDSRDPKRHRKIAATTPNAIVVENVDLTDFIRFAESFDFDESDSVEDLIDFASDIMTGVGAPQMKTRIKTLIAGRARKDATEAELAALNFSEEPTPKHAAMLLVAINKQSGVRRLRPALFTACVQSFNNCKTQDDFHQMAMDAREQQRTLGRVIPSRAVGSTLLLKGLEADTVVVLDTHSMNAKHLYVAITRGARKLVICSTSQRISPSPN